MTSIHRVPVGIVYHEGGDSYRPFIVLNVPLQNNWLSPNISFFQSSGRSSDNVLENELRRDTWFPTIGLLVERSPLYDHLRSVDEENANIYTNGYIIKLSALFKIFKVPYTTWKWIGVFQTNLGWLNVKSIAKDSVFRELVSSKEEYDQILNLGFFLFKYCVFWWQVQISAQLDGGLWKKYPKLREIALHYDMNEYDANSGFIKRETPLPEIQVDVDAYMYKKDDNASPNINEVNQYLVENHALYDFSNIPFPAKEVRMKLLQNKKMTIIAKPKTKSVTPIEMEMEMEMEMEKPKTKSIIPSRRKIKKTVAYKATNTNKPNKNKPKTNTTRKLKSNSKSK